MPTTEARYQDVVACILVKKKILIASRPVQKFFQVFTNFLEVSIIWRISPGISTQGTKRSWT